MALNQKEADHTRVVRERRSIHTGDEAPRSQTQECLLAVSGRVEDEMIEACLEVGPNRVHDPLGGRLDDPAGGDLFDREPVRGSGQVLAGRHADTSPPG